MIIMMNIRYGLTKLDTQNVQDIRRNHEKLESGIDSRRKKLSWSENPEWYIPGRCAITITISDNEDATQSHI